MFNGLQRRLMCVVFLMLCTAGGALAQNRLPFQTDFLMGGNLPISYARSFLLFGGDNSTTATDILGITYSYNLVPATKRLVIEQVSVRFKVPSGQMGEVSITSQVRLPSGGITISNTASHFFAPVNKVNGSKDWFSMTQPTKIYAGPGTSLSWTFTRSDTGYVDTLQITLSGYYEDATQPNQY